MNMLKLNPLLHVLLIGTLLNPTAGAAETSNTVLKGPVKVFLMAGQSNMEGHAMVHTFDYIGDDPATAPLLKKMRNPDGTPKVCDHVWISYFTGMKGVNGEGFGKLTAGYGSRKNPTKDGGKIGLEFTFGLRMDEALQQPVLIIKTAWGGTSLSADFRPPSAGPIEGKSAEETGRYYRLMIDHVRMVLKDIKRVIPEYDENQGYEIAGFVWLQGWNDAVDARTYPKVPEGQNRYAKYSEWLADLIRDVRKDLNAPQMPFVIGVMGIDGPQVGRRNFFREAMAAPASYPEFNGNVVAVQTTPFWDEPLGEIFNKQVKVNDLKHRLESQVKIGKLTKEEADKQASDFRDKLITPEETKLWERGASNGSVHYLGCAKTFALMGQAFANAILEIPKS